MCDIELICLIFFIFLVHYNFEIFQTYYLRVLSHTWKKCIDKQEPKEIKIGILDNAKQLCIGVQRQRVLTKITTGEFTIGVFPDVLLFCNKVKLVSS